jgi:hypothetical protein
VEHTVRWRVDVDGARRVGVELAAGPTRRGGEEVRGVEVGCVRCGASQGAEGEEGFGERDDLLGVRGKAAQRRVVIFDGAGLAQGDVDLGREPRERGAEFVAGVVDELLLTFRGALLGVEHRVER